MSAATVALACLAPLGVLMATQVRPVQALDIAYCAGINTASRSGSKFFLGGAFAFAPSSACLSLILD